jgi:hypothetical protein
MVFIVIIVIVVVIIMVSCFLTSFFAQFCSISLKFAQFCSKFLTYFAHFYLILPYFCSILLNFALFWRYVAYFLYIFDLFLTYFFLFPPRYTRPELLQTESQVLSALAFRVTVPTAKVFLRRWVKVGWQWQGGSWEGQIGGVEKSGKRAFEWW